MYTYTKYEEQCNKKKNDKKKKIRKIRACIAKEVVTLEHNRREQSITSNEYSFTRRLYRPFSFIPETRRKG